MSLRYNLVVFISSSEFPTALGYHWSLRKSARHPQTKSGFHHSDWVKPIRFCLLSVLREIHAFRNFYASKVKTPMHWRADDLYWWVARGLQHTRTGVGHFGWVMWRWAVTSNFRQKESLVTNRIINFLEFAKKSGLTWPILSTLRYWSECRSYLFINLTKPQNRFEMTNVN